MAVDFGKTIRILREAKGLSMSEMAERAKISTAFLSLIEKGERHPSVKVLRQLAETLGIPAEVLVQLAMGGVAASSAPKRTVAITRAVQQLADMEAKLRRLLSKKEAEDATKSNQSIDNSKIVRND